LRWEAALRARAGIAYDTTLLNVTAGPSYAKMRNRFFTINTFASNGNDKVYGYNAGAGIEQKLVSSLSVGVEYMFHRYNDNDARTSVTQGTAGATNPFVLAGGVDFRRSDTRFQWNTLKATAALRF
jgi:outer membrane immunogenic protein